MEFGFKRRDRVKIVKLPENWIYSSVVVGETDSVGIKPVYQSPTRPFKSPLISLVLCA